MSQIDLSKYQVRTDLIIEDDECNHQEEHVDNIIVNRTKRDGNYITISFNDITNFEDREKVGKVVEEEIKKIIEINKISEDEECLIIGLGNLKSTPDSLGVKTLSDIVVTKHLFKLGEATVGFRSVATFIPGVMANTGIESSDLIEAVIKKINPKFIIAIDALAAKRIDRINKTIQITDTGIHPGSGIGNNRREISKKTMGIPVIAVGVPTVVTSSTIVYDTIDYLFKHISYIKENEDTSKLTIRRINYKNKIKDKSLSNEEKNKLMGLFGNLSNNEQRSLIDEVLQSTELNLIVTPTEIDFLIDKLSNLIASSLNNSLHRQINHF